MKSEFLKLDHCSCHPRQGCWVSSGGGAGLEVIVLGNAFP